VGGEECEYILSVRVSGAQSFAQPASNAAPLLEETAERLLPSRSPFARSASSEHFSTYGSKARFAPVVSPSRARRFASRLPSPPRGALFRGAIVPVVAIGEIGVAASHLGPPSASSSQECLLRLRAAASRRASSRASGNAVRTRGCNSASAFFHTR